MPGADESNDRASQVGPQRSPGAGGSLSIDKPREIDDLRRFSHEAMATIFEVHAVHPNALYAGQAARAAFDLVDRLERDLSRFRQNSDVARINSLSSGESTRVSASTLECLLVARHAFDLTGGAFDISIGTGLPLLEIDADDFVVRAAEGGVRIDLGGIGKGYAVDLVAELLEDWGLEAALVHGGFSSVLALEAPPGRVGWPLTLSDPRPPSRVLARLDARQAALGASGLRKGDHIVDPRTGEPVRGRFAAWVALPRPAPRPALAPGEATVRLAPTAIADALTTAFMLLSPVEIRGLCDASPGLEAWILEEPGSDPSGETDLIHFGRAQA